MDGRATRGINFLRFRLLEVKIFKLNITVGILKAMFNRGQATDVANLPDGRV